MTTPAKRSNLLPLLVFFVALGGGFLLWKFVFQRDTPVTNSLGMEFRLIPAGTFTMGSPPNEDGRRDDEKEHEVEITRPFYLGRQEVTQQQFEKVMGFNPVVVRTGDAPKGSLDYPVENVSWDEAVEFCKKLSELPEEKAAGRSYRLPTEAEWEYACRAGKKGQPFGFGDRLTKSDANLFFDLYKKRKKDEPIPDPPVIRPVGSLRANPWQMYDMHGNVWEWCSDWYAPDSHHNGPRSDPQGPNEGTEKVVRGGSRVNDPLTARSARRGHLAPGIRLGIGFRVVMVEGAGR